MRLLLLAGEESGLLYARQIAAATRRLSRDLEVRGYEDYGFETKDLAVMGIGAVLARLFYFMRVKRTMERAIENWRPDVVCTIDYPGMNLKLAAYAKARGIRTLHVVCPQVWAWKRGRIPKIEASVDRLCCFFPFEPALFRPGFATFVGHPLVDAFRTARRNLASSDVEGLTTIALLPGSRLGEIAKVLPTMLTAAEALNARFAGLNFVIPAANASALAAIRRLARRSGLWDTDRVSIREGGARELLLTAHCAVVASGTATLEAALARCPTVLVYKVGWFFELVARFVIRGIRHIGLANIIAEKGGVTCPMPELLQRDFTAERVVALMAGYIGDKSLRAQAVAQLDRAMALLSSDGDSITKIAHFLV